MTPLKDALEIIKVNAPLVSEENILLDDSLGRILSQDIQSDIDLPPFDKSSMDGFACKREDLGKELALVETIMAGMVPKQQILPGQCSKIMTGAMIPQGADCVFMVEDSNEENEKIRFTGKETQTNISYQGEYIKIGDQVIREGTSLGPQHVNILASVGMVELPVCRKVSVGIISTGDELVPPNETPALSQLRDSNSSQLISQVKRCGAIANFYGIASDTEKNISDKFEQALSENDLILLTGGVSMGELDLVKLIINKKADQIFFETLRVKPGKPTVFAKVGNKFCFGLPGNPISSFVIFELLVKPFILKSMNHDFTPVQISMPLGETIEIRNSDREMWTPVKLDNGVIIPLPYGGSGHTNSLAQADGLISIPFQTKKIERGTILHVRQI